MIEVIMTYNDAEAIDQSFKRHNDQELIELVSEVNWITGKRHLVNPLTFKYCSGHLWWRKEQVITRYSLVIEHRINGHLNYQQFNFPPIPGDPGQASINTYATKGQLMTYFLGIINSVKQ
jgi:hypothetical protein